MERLDFECGSVAACHVLVFPAGFLSIDLHVQVKELRCHKGGTIMARTPTEQQMEAAARSYFHYVTKGDVEGILSLFADDALMINPMSGEQGFAGKRRCEPSTRT